MSTIVYHGFEQPATRRRSRAAHDLIESYAQQEWLIEASLLVEVRCYPGLFNVGTLYAVHLEASWPDLVLLADGLDSNLLGSVTEAFFNLRQRAELNEAF